MAPGTLPDHAYLLQCFRYDPATGVLSWLNRPLEHFRSPRGYNTWNTKWSGKEAGYIAPTGYRKLSLDAHPYLAHRLIYKLVTGIDPPRLDHRNQNTIDNRWNNLRPASQQQNSHNRATRRDSVTGIKGVHQSPAGHYVALIWVNERKVWLGTFPTAEAAHAAYCEAAKAHFGEFWNAGLPVIR